MLPLLIAMLLPAADASTGLAEKEALVARAEAEFRAGIQLREAADLARPHFKAAAEAFEELRRLGVSNPSLYHDLGSAYLLAGDLPHAILSYRRGLRLAPWDRTLQTDLDQAREHVSYPENATLGRPPTERWPTWLPPLRLEVLFGSAGLLYALAWLQATRWLMHGRGRLLVLAVMALAAAAGLGFLFLKLTQLERVQEAAPLVVIAQDDVVLRRGNSRRFPPRYDASVNRGVEARLLHHRGDWMQIELADGATGWIPRLAALVDAEPSVPQ